MFRYANYSEIEGTGLLAKESDNVQLKGIMLYVELSLATKACNVRMGGWDWNRSQGQHLQIWVLSPRDDTCFSQVSFTWEKNKCDSSNVPHRRDYFHWSNQHNSQWWYFLGFVRGSLISNMLPFDGVNKRSVVVMDNCFIHHIEPVTSLLNKAGIVTLFLPPYSPDLNPIEEVFSYVKCYLRKHILFCSTSLILLM